jgi:hypothetical protein
MWKILGVVVLVCSVCSACTAQSASVLRSSNLRQSPSRSSQLVGSLNAGDSVKITASSPTAGYLPVQTSGGATGWILAKNVSIVTANLRTQRLTRLQSDGSEEFSPSCSDPAFPSPDTTSIDSQCGVPGVGSAADQAQNEQKNNFCSSGTARTIHIQDLAALQQTVQDAASVNFGSTFNSHPLSETPGPARDRSTLVNLPDLHEGMLVSLIGFVAGAAGEGPETVNCNLGTKSTKDAPLHDIHISIVDGASNTDKCTGVVAEMIPHHRPDAWTPKILNQVKTSGQEVRVTGNLMFDSSHTPCINDKALSGDPLRVSLWEVHPIYKFEICTTGSCSDTGTEGWVNLEVWQPQ